MTISPAWNSMRRCLKATDPKRGIGRLDGNPLGAGSCLSIDLGVVKLFSAQARTQAPRRELKPVLAVECEL